MTEVSYLYGDQSEALQNALVSAFYNRNEWKQFFALELDRDLDEIIAGAPKGLDAIALAVVLAAATGGWTDDLIRKAHARNPGNPDLKRFHDQYIASSPKPDAKFPRELRAPLRGALLSAYPAQAALAQLLRFDLGRSLETITELNTIASSVIADAEGRGWTDTLIRKAYEYRPGNPELKRFYERYMGSVQREVDRTIAAQPTLERLLPQLTGFMNIRVWREGLQQVEARVCRLEAFGPNNPMGTGFLIGRDLVMTNYHVFKPVFSGQLKPEHVRVRFDHYYLPDGKTLSPGTEHRLHTDWEVAKSPPSPLDEKFDATDAPGLDTLDFVIVRLSHDASQDKVDDGPRGFFPYRRGAVEFKPDMDPNVGLIVAQHPGGDPMKLAMNTNANVKTVANASRVRYQVNTSPGSSGSPVFNLRWELVALHHSGNPEHDARYNQGIPLDTIRDNLPVAVRATLGW
jgi:hypothetical protein